MHVACLVPEVLELLEELVKAYSCLELTHYLYLRGMYCVQSLCEVVSLSSALVVASPLLGFSCILFKMCNLWVNFEASMWSQGKCLRILHLLLSAATAGIMRWKIIAGGKMHEVIALMLEPLHESAVGPHSFHQFMHQVWNSWRFVLGLNVCYHHPWWYR